jgi:predicted Zn-dependent protease with MMP-like domain
MLRLSSREFERLVAEALDSLPDELWEALDNVEVTVAPYPTRDQLRSAGVTNGTLLGLYEGIPLTARNSGYTFVLPDKITIFQRPIERICGSFEEVVAQVRETVIHELAHHFGIDDDRLDELGWN